MKYTQKDICTILNITRETLRHYERQGLIIPEISPDNRYRYYDDYQMYLIAECKRYQANEFSLKEIREMLGNDSLDTYISRMEARTDSFRKKADYYHSLADENSVYADRLKNIRSDLNKIQTVYLRPICFAAQKSGRTLYTDSVHAEAGRILMARLQHSFMMAVFPDYAEDEYEWGFGLRQSDSSDIIPGGTVIPAANALRTVIDTGSEWDFHTGCCRSLIRYAQEHRFEPAGPLIMRQLVSIHEAGQMHRYFEAYLPLKDEK